MLKLDFTGRVAVVTGASSGIGAAFAKALAAQGADVAVLARRVEKLEAVAAECRESGVRCLPVACDVTDEQSIKAAVAKVVDEFGRIDILINNAGVCEFAPLEDHTTDQWNKVISTDLSSVFLMTREVAPIFKEQQYGRVINTASVGAYEAGAMQIGYFAAKGGVLQMTRALAAELAPYGVLVNGIAPGVFATERLTACSRPRARSCLRHVPALSASPSPRSSARRCCCSPARRTPTAPARPSTSTAA